MLLCLAVCAVFSCSKVKEPATQPSKYLATAVIPCDTGEIRFFASGKPYVSVINGNGSPVLNFLDTLNGAVRRKIVICINSIYRTGLYTTENSNVSYGCYENYVGAVSQTVFAYCSVYITEYSPGRIVGNFSARLVDSTVVAWGSFDVPYQRPE